MVTERPQFFVFSSHTTDSYESETILIFNFTWIIQTRGHDISIILAFLIQCTRMLCVRVPAHDRLTPTIVSPVKKSTEFFCFNPITIFQSKYTPTLIPR
jgi:hypothetical protein